MKKIAIITILLISYLSHSQNFKFGKVSKEELQQEEHPTNSDVNAAFLFKKQYINFPFNENDGFTQDIKVHERVKIYDKEGFEWATKKIQLYDENSSKRQKVVNLKAYTYTLVNGKVKKTKLKSESVFEKKNNQYWRTKTFTMPGLLEGCIIEYEYVIKSPFLSIDDLVLQEEIPINKLEFDVITPEYFNYNKLVNPKSSYIPKIQESKRRRKETISSKSRSGNRTVSSTTTISNFDFTENVIKVYQDDIPGLTKEPYTNNIDSYKTKVALEYAYFRGRDSKVKSYATTWEKIAENINKNENFGGELKKNKYFKEVIDNLISETKSNSEKLNLIFNYVQNNIKWNDFVGVLTSKGLKSAFKDKVGNIADINLMLVSMLRYAGLNANPVLVSTKSNGVPLFPTQSGFNYVICAVEDTDNVILLDASNPNTKPNIIPEFVINWKGRLIRENGSSTWIDLNPKNISKSMILANYHFNEDLSISGKAREVKTNYEALSFRDDNLSSQSIIQKLENKHLGLTISNLEVKNTKSKSKPILNSYEFNIENGPEVIADKLYLSPLLFFNQKENPFIQDTRLYPVDFVFPRSNKITVGFELPEGYIAEFVPEKAMVSFNDGEASFSYLIKQTANNFQLIATLDINKTLILPKDYENFKSFYQLVIDKYNEKIVLKKQ
ncbi:DUF3857 domain-containing protein [Olleya sp. ITB9]|uniref:DUF3857 domain-containing protein n=1 Tax=Olleya sp. ITB9 TaxID=1715648 RepID=UPI0006D0B55F|nr:DUF3857 domain-containing protein [Olleya sp. ITB9]